MNIAHLTLQDKWDFLTKYSERFEWTTQTAQDYISGMSIECMYCTYITIYGRFFDYRITLFPSIFPNRKLCEYDQRDKETRRNFAAVCHRIRGTSTDRVVPPLERHTSTRKRCSARAVTLLGSHNLYCPVA